MNRLFIRTHLQRFLEEDVGTGDITAELVCNNEIVTGRIVAKEDGVLAGVPFVHELFMILGNAYVKPFKLDGDVFKKGDVILEIEGRAEVVLTGERLSLNLLQSLSGIASTARRFAEALKGTKIRLLDTRKTTPGYRFFEKYAVRAGGGNNHRFALYDMVLIKDNHKKVAGGLRSAIRRVKEKASPAYKIEVEVESLEELEEVVAENIDIVMLDNFTPEEVKEAVSIIQGRLEIEVSGNITLDNIDEFIIDGVDYISSGSVIYASRWCDLSLKVL